MGPREGRDEKEGGVGKGKPSKGANDVGLYQWCPPASVVFRDDQPEGPRVEVEVNAPKQLNRTGAPATEPIALIEKLFAFGQSIQTSGNRSSAAIEFRSEHLKHSGPGSPSVKFTLASAKYGKYPFALICYRIKAAPQFADTRLPTHVTFVGLYELIKNEESPPIEWHLVESYRNNTESKRVPRMISFKKPEA